MKVFSVIFLLLFISCSNGIDKNKAQPQKVSNSKQATKDSINIIKENAFYIESKDSIFEIDPVFHHFSSVSGNIYKYSNKRSFFNEYEIDRILLFFQDSVAYGFKGKVLYRLEKNGQSQKIGTIEVDTVFLTNNYLFAIKDKVLYNINPNNQQLDSIINLDKKLNKVNGYSNADIIIHQLSQNIIQLEFSRYHSGCYDFDTYLVDVASKRILYDNIFKIEEPDNKFFKTCFYLADQDSKTFLCRFDRSKTFKSDVDYLFDADFNILSELPAKIESSFPCGLCEYGNYFAGIQMTKNKLNAFYLATRYKDKHTKNNYFIPYSFNPKLEILFSKLYNNEKLDSEEIKNLKLMNLIF
jgi:hypothetical protein